MSASLHSAHLKQRSWNLRARWQRTVGFERSPTCRPISLVGDDAGLILLRAVEDRFSQWSPWLGLSDGLLAPRSRSHVHNVGPGALTELRQQPTAAWEILILGTVLSRKEHADWAAAFSGAALSTAAPGICTALLQPFSRRCTKPALGACWHLEHLLSNSTVRQGRNRRAATQSRVVPQLSVDAEEGGDDRIATLSAPSPQTENCVGDS